MADHAELAKRVLVDGVVVAGLLALLRQFKRTRHVHVPVPHKSVPEELPPSKRYVVIPDPGRTFKAANPPWLVEAVRAAEEGPSGQVEGLPECPALANFVDKVQRIGFSMEPGRQARKVLFALDPGVRYLNHGSYGATFKLASLVQAWYLEVLEQQSVRFMETRALAALRAAREDLAEFVGAEACDVVTMPNATQAVNTVVGSLELQPRDLILTTSLTYPAVKNICARVCGRTGAGMVEVQLPLAVVQSEAAILAAFTATIAAAGSRIRLAIIDHVASFPPVLCPVQQICALCRQYGIKVLVDGAHAVGAMPLDLPSLGAHYYTSNLHKWFCTPKGTAFLWVHRKEQAGLRPVVTSHGYGLGFQAEFAYNGTSDPTAWLAVPAALAVFKAVRPATIRQHNHELLQQAVALLQRAWRTDTVIGAAAPFACMAAIELPDLPSHHPSSESAWQIHMLLRDVHNIEVPCTFWEGRLWVRISAQLFNVVEEYEALAQAITGLVADVGES